MAEHGIRDFLVAKRKALHASGVTDGAVLPKNTEIELALVEHQRLFGGETHTESLHAQRGRGVARHAPARSAFDPRYGSVRC